MGTYHPTLSDAKALTLVRAALDVRRACILALKEMAERPGGPRYGIITSLPSLRRRPGAASGLMLCFEFGVPVEIASEWGAIQIAESCTEATTAQTKEILQRLTDAGVIMDFGDGNPDTDKLLEGAIKSVNGVELPPYEHYFNGVFSRFTQAVRSFQAASAEAYRPR